MSAVDLGKLPDIILDQDEPVFNEPWEAQAFALVVHLHQRGAFEWEEWAACLSAQIHGGQDVTYYQHWLNALEVIVAQKNLTSRPDLLKRKQAWHEAAARTPHGAPIEL